jgi:hypothetical protein
MTRRRRVIIAAGAAIQHPAIPDAAGPLEHRAWCSALTVSQPGFGANPTERAA